MELAELFKKNGKKIWKKFLAMLALRQQKKHFLKSVLYDGFVVRILEC